LITSAEDADISPTSLGRKVPVGELELDAPVAGGVGGGERLELAVACRDQALVGDALLVQELHHGDGARGRQLPVGRIEEAVDRLVVGVAVDLQHPVDALGDARGDLDQALGDAGQLLTEI
jgi:hypothetical protein